MVRGSSHEMEPAYLQAHLPSDKTAKAQKPCRLSSCLPNFLRLKASLVAIVKNHYIYLLENVEN